jgi:hypothetical protein
MIFAASHLQRLHCLTLHSLPPPLPAPPHIPLITFFSSNAHHHSPHPHQQLLVGRPSGLHGSWPFRNVSYCIYILIWQFRNQLSQLLS